MTIAKTKRNLTIFIIVALTCGWFGVLIDTVLPEQPGEETLGMLLWLVAPILTGFLLRAFNRDWKDAGLAPKLKKSWKWYLVALLAFPTVTLISVSLAYMFGSVEIKGLSVAILPLLAISFFQNIVKNFFEEFAWRGYLTPKLMALKLNDWVLYIVSGLIWVFWHIPYWLIFLPDSAFENIALTRIMMIPVSAFVMVCWTVVYVELYRLTKSVWSSVVFHAAEDAVPTLLVVQGYFIFTQTGTFLFDPALGGVVAALLFLGIGLKLRAIRIKKESNENALMP